MRLLIYPGITPVDKVGQHMGQQQAERVHGEQGIAREGVADRSLHQASHRGFGVSSIRGITIV